MTTQRRPDPDRVLAGLKDFQQATVDYAFRRLYTDAEPTDRFLVADEVGLGKTLVARGLIARAVDHLWDDVERIDVIYICSNADIARQNINRLNVTERGDFALSSRITLLPTQVQGLKDNRLNFISFTPGTSLDPKSLLGTAQERALLYWLLHRAWGFGARTAGPRNVLQGLAGRDGFEWWLDSVGRERGRYIDQSLAEDYAHELQRHDEVERSAGRAGFRERFDDLCDRMRRIRKDYGRIPQADRDDRSSLIGELRATLAGTCVKALEPDLVILDEFQRFKYLLQGDDHAATLARELFSWQDAESEARARVLLLSATPYKMYTLASESAEEDHHRDFLATIDFLYGHDVARTGELKRALTAYKHELLASSDRDLGRLRSLRDEVQSRLRGVVARTEHLAVSDDRNGMLVQKENEGMQLTAGDVGTYLTLQRVARALRQPDTVEYWKSAPYLFNFMDSYQLKRRFKEALDDPELAPKLTEAIEDDGSAFIPWDRVGRYEAVGAGNARMRSLLEDVVGRGAWRALWIPPALAYYELAGAYVEPGLQELTKRLVFSSWHVVPKAIASILTYAAEAEMMRAFEDQPVNSPEARESRARLLEFGIDNGRLAGMPVVGILYPSPALARACDPLKLARDGSEPVKRTMADAVNWATERVEKLLDQLESHDKTLDGAQDERWYWAAPLLFDLASAPEETRAWWSDEGLAARWAGGQEDDSADSRWAEHIAQARQVVSGELQLGRPPSDLGQLLAVHGLAAPGVSALRAVARVTGDEEMLDDPDARNAAARIAWALRSLFNLPEVTALLRSGDRGTPYWRRVLDYSLEGCLQAVLDEYAHVLVESLGVAGKKAAIVAGALAEEMEAGLTVRAARLGVDNIRAGSNGGLELEAGTMRSQFAARFGQEQSDDGTVTRAGQLRQAFNSPFWPFVLATTSVGQEGLDFHVYCHAVVHWNLPSNPVDMEQREGRVHRYKGHAVRKNLAMRHGEAIFRDGDATDPWVALFQRGVGDRDEDDNELVPYWIYSVDGGAKIERHVPALPMSRDLLRLDSLRRSLAVYRMAFGQSRQEDLVAYLLSRCSEAEVRRLLGELRIDLSPPAQRLAHVQVGSG